MQQGTKHIFLDLDAITKVEDKNAEKLQERLTEYCIETYNSDNENIKGLH